jgi:replicative DNA helicase
MPNCQYCNKPVISGTVCQECAQRQQNNQQRPSGGFSLNSLLRNSFPTPASRQPQAPVQPMPQQDFSNQPVQPTAQPIPATAFQPSQPSFTPNQSFNGNQQFPNQQPMQQQASSAMFSATPQIQTQSHYAPDPNISAAALDKIVGPSNSSKINKESEEEQKELRERVFNSPATGFGDEELEVTVLAGIMKDQYVLESLKGKGLMVGLFSNHHTRSIYQAILALREESSSSSKVDKIILKNKLRQMNIFDDLATRLLDKISECVPPSVEQSLNYLELLKEQALKRKLKEVAQNISGYIETPPTDNSITIETFTNRVIQDVRDIQKSRTTKRINLVKEEMRDIINDIDQREINGEIDIIGYSFEPMHYLCQAVSGFRKGFMYAIAGAPRRGKTTFTLELATRVATLNKIPVLFFTYEQTKKNLTYRLLAKESRLNPDMLQRKKIRSNMINDAKFSGGWKKMQEYMNYFYIIEATKEDTIDRIRSYAYNVMQDFNTNDIMIFVDYIQKMPLSRNYMDEKFKVEEISTELKGLSIELNNPIMTISSLSKEGCLIDASNDAERPTMYHCKGSGDLEYDLDCAMIQAKDWGDTYELYQQLQQKAEQLGKDTTRIPKVDVVNLYLDKNRDAPEGIFSVIQYLFFIEDNKFIELGPKYDDDRYRFSKIEELVDKLIQANFIIFFDRPADSTYNKGRVSIKLKNF